MALAGYKLATAGPKVGYGQLGPGIFNSQSKPRTPGAPKPKHRDDPSTPVYPLEDPNLVHKKCGYFFAEAGKRKLYFFLNSHKINPVAPALRRSEALEVRHISISSLSAVLCSTDGKVLG
jgi:hypothetical protein